MQTQHSYGWKKDIPDSRDNLYALHYAGKPRPTKVNLVDQKIISPVGDQGSLGSCTGWGIGNGMMESLNLKYDFLPDTALSALFIYQMELIAMNAFGRDEGARIRDGMKVVANIGCAVEKDWPYEISRFGIKPNNAVIASASKFKIRTYHRLRTLDDMKGCLADGFGFAFGFIVRSSFETITNNGVMPMPGFWERYLGGHCVFGCGYEDDDSFVSGKWFSKKRWPGGGYLYVKNSWGVGWGENGFFKMPYAYINPVNVQDVWTAR